MRILIITRYAWDDRIASGNTLSNLFGGWPDTSIYTIYCRDAKPENNCCNNYYSVSPLNLIRNIFTPWRIGHKFETKNTDSKIDNNQTERSLTVLSKKSKVFSILYDFLYSTRLWLNRRLKTYVKEAHPDIVFCFGVSDAFNYFLVKYIKQIIGIPVVSYYVDDHYKTNLHFWNFIKKNRVKRLERLALMSDKCYAISQLMCDEYSELMGVKFELLTKGCEVNDICIKNNNPIRIVYAGNLLYNRDKTLISMIQAIQIINHTNNNKFHLDIYTSTYVSDEIKNKMNVEGVASLYPPKPYAEIKDILNSSDIVLHVESFDKEQERIVRLSFSTKITDCLQSGSMVMGIGPTSVASIDFLKNTPGVITITDTNQIVNKLQSLAENSQTILENAKITHEYAREEMSMSRVQKRLQNDLIGLVYRH